MLQNIIDGVLSLNFGDLPCTKSIIPLTVGFRKGVSLFG